MEYIVPILVIACIFVLGAMVSVARVGWGTKLACIAVVIFLFWAAIDQAITSLHL